MLDHIFLSVGDVPRAVAFYESVLPVLGITARLDYDGQDGPPGHPDLKGFGAKGRMFFWLRAGTAAPGAVHVGFVAGSEAMEDAAYVPGDGGGRHRDPPARPAAAYDPRYLRQRFDYLREPIWIT
jgi:catechol 2,3-dioxygenase-like lactoylglutathione lyase family enzyme